MLSDRETVTLFMGNYGSGKTEVAVNFALHLAENDFPMKLALVDLDLVNPYFRSRETRQVLEDAGIRVILPDAQYMHADLPILVPAVRSVLMASTSYAILDVGGDDVGARVVGALSDALDHEHVRALMVVNANRPFTGDATGVERICREIEAAGHINMAGFVSNTHLMEETVLETILEGVELSRKVETLTGIPLEFVCVPRDLVDEVKKHVSEDILPIRRLMMPPWKAPEGGAMGKDIFRLL